MTKSNSIETKTLQSVLRQSLREHDEAATAAMRQAQAHLERANEIAGQLERLKRAAQ